MSTRVYPLGVGAHCHKQEQVLITADLFWLQSSNIAKAKFSFFQHLKRSWIQICLHSW